jgi:hypothetical protein
MGSFDKRYIRSKEGFEASIRHFAKFSSVLRGCTDIDLFYERNGQFLIMEGKEIFDENWQHYNVPWGQWYALYQLQRAIPTKMTLLQVVHYHDKKTGNNKYWVTNINKGEKLDNRTTRFMRFHFEEYDIAGFNGYLQKIVDRIETSR